MMLNHQFQGSIEGFEIWDEWSSTAPNYLETETHDEMLKRYNGFVIDLKKKNRATTILSLLKKHEDVASQIRKENRGHVIVPNQIESPGDPIPERPRRDTPAWSLTRMLRLLSTL